MHKSRNLDPEKKGPEAQETFQIRVGGPDEGKEKPADDQRREYTLVKPGTYGKLLGKDTRDGRAPTAPEKGHGYGRRQSRLQGRSITTQEKRIGGAFVGTSGGGETLGTQGGKALRPSRG